MNKYIALLLIAITALYSFSSYAYYDSHRYNRPHGQWVCNPYNKLCHKAYRHDRGYSSYEREKRKQYRKKHASQNTGPKHIYVAPPQKIAQSNIININLYHGTWAAYDSEGNLLNSGHVSGGKSFCPDINKACKTTTGTYTIYEKRDSGCKSKIFPVGKGGAPMPYCMFFHRGYALHGSNAVPNYNASHGCVRMSPADAQWLNQNFVIVGTTRVNVTYDKVEPEEKQATTESMESNIPVIEVK